MTKTDDTWVLAGKRWSSRLILGTGKYVSYQQNLTALEAAEVQMVTVAIRRVNLEHPSGQGSGQASDVEKGGPLITDIIDPSRYLYLPNTAGCYTAQEALRTLRLAREMGGWRLVKLEVIGDKKTLYPNMRETFRAAEVLIKEGFDVMAYTIDDPVATGELEAMGCVAVMPLAAPIGSGLGIQNALNLSLIVERANVPVLVDAGVGCASDASLAMELGCDGVLLNSAVSNADDVVMMARAMKLAVEAGRLSYLAGRMKKRQYGRASSPMLE